jgi:hypothetical protein
MIYSELRQNLKFTQTCLNGGCLFGLDSWTIAYVMMKYYGLLAALYLNIFKLEQVRTDCGLCDPYVSLQ